MLILDPTTLAEYLVSDEADARAQAVLNAFTGTIYVRVYDGSDTLMGEGTMAAPWATRSGSTITVGELASFSVLANGTPNAASWYLRLETAGGRWIRGPFGPGGSFTWSLGTWRTEQAGQIGTVTLNAQGLSGILGAAFASSQAAANLYTSGTPYFTIAPTSATVQSTGGNISFSAVDPNWGAITYTLQARYRNDITIGSTTGVVSVPPEAAGTSGSIIVRATDPAGLYAEASCAVTVAAASAGSFVHGQPYTITGSGFGTKATAAPVLWDNITNGGYGTITDGAVVPAGASYLWSGDSETGAHDNVRFSTTTTRANSKPTYTANATAGILKNTGRQRTKTGYVYVSWWFRPATSIPGGDHSSKFLRVSDSRSLTGMTFSWTQQQSIIFDAINPNVQTGAFAQYAANNWHASGMTGGAWNFVETWFDTPNRRYTIRVNNAPVVNTLQWDTDSDFTPNILWMLGWDGGGNAVPTLQWWIDCVYHDNSLARVMLGNASTYSACTAFEMQPATAWSDTSITVTANRGAAAVGSTRYLYVINSSGAVVNSSGYSVTVN